MGAITTTFTIDILLLIFATHGLLKNMITRNGLLLQVRSFNFFLSGQWSALHHGFSL